MGLNQQASSERLHIGFFGLRNAGKSSVVNAVTGQNVSVVSAVMGTTTDPVKKAMELLPIGPVVIIDTPGIDDEGELGELRVKQTRKILRQTDVAVLVVDGWKGLTDADRELLALFQKRNIPYIIAMNKCDLKISAPENAKADDEGWKNIENHTDSERLEHIIDVSALTGKHIYELKELIGKVGKSQTNDKRIVGDLIAPGDVVVLVTPIDAAAPKGRLILPQQQTIRDILDANGINVVVKETELEDTLTQLGHLPKLVITDSQVFEKVNQIVPKDMLLTSFSILFARYKGNLDTLVNGAAMLDRLQENDHILISEGCTHHRQCGDIGTDKLPKWIGQYTKKNLEFHFTSGTDFPEDLSDYAIVIHCGGCMLNEREMKSRLLQCEEAGIPVTNYGTAIAKMNGILDRTLEPFEKSKLK